MVRAIGGIDAELLARFDDLLERKGYGNRSEGVRDLVRGALVWRIRIRGSTTAALDGGIEESHALLSGPSGGAAERDDRSTVLAPLP